MESRTCREESCFCVSLLPREEVFAPVSPEPAFASHERHQGPCRECREARIE